MSVEVCAARRKRLDIFPQCEGCKRPLRRAIKLVESEEKSETKPTPTAKKARRAISKKK